MIKKYIGALYIANRWYGAMAVGVVLFFLSFFFSFLWALSLIYIALLGLLTISDYFLLFSRSGIRSGRDVRPVFDLGHENEVTIRLHNDYAFDAALAVIDEVPAEFQVRDFLIRGSIGRQSGLSLTYMLRPVKRGAYAFGDLVVYASSPIGLLRRRYKNSETGSFKVYPTPKLTDRKSIDARLGPADALESGKGVKAGQSLEFDQIKEYIAGDDIRNINWKSTARNASMMVNHYIESRSQQVYCIVDKGRTMKMPFDQMSLMDYAINASLAISKTVLAKYDKAGIVTFGHLATGFLQADRKADQLLRIKDHLYAQSTQFQDSHFEPMVLTLMRKINQRSLLILFTNFETLAAMERQLPYLRKLASRHLLLVVFFENTLIRDLQNGYPDDLEGIYIKTIADRFVFEKRQIVKELGRYGIQSLLTAPSRLGTDTINKYLEIKQRRLI